MVRAIVDQWPYSVSVPCLDQRQECKDKYKYRQLNLTLDIVSPSVLVEAGESR
jgi:hypothetical protein